MSKENEGPYIILPRSLVRQRPPLPRRDQQRGMLYVGHLVGMMGFKRAAGGGAAAGGPFPVDAADFQADNLTRSSLFTGQAASKKGIFSAWLLTDGTNGTLFNGQDAGGTSYCTIDLSNSGSNAILRVTMKDVGLSQLVVMANSTGFTTGAWHHVAAAWDLATAGARMIMVDGVSDTSVTTFSNTANIAYDQCVRMGGMANFGNSLKYSGGVAEYYWADGQYLDLTNATNLQKFRAGGFPVDLGATGSTPTGTAPRVYCHLADGEAVANFATNRSGNGNWTINGTLATRSTSPSD